MRSQSENNYHHYMINFTYKAMTDCSGPELNTYKVCNIQLGNNIIIADNVVYLM